MPKPDKGHWFVEDVYPHESSLRSYLRRAFPGVRDVDDVVQESYLRILRARNGRPKGSGRAFLFKVAQRLAIDFLRRRGASPIQEETDLTEWSVIDGGRDVADAVCTKQEILLLTEAIDSLPARCREVVILRRLKGMSQKQIAKELGISEQTVQVQASRGLKRCAIFLRKRGMVPSGRNDEQEL